MRVAKLAAPVTGMFGEEVERFFDRFLTPGFFPEPFIPPFPYEAAGAEWFPAGAIFPTGTILSVVIDLESTPRFVKSMWNHHEGPFRGNVRGADGAYQ